MRRSRATTCLDDHRVGEDVNFPPKSYSWLLFAVFQTYQQGTQACPLPKSIWGWLCSDWATQSIRRSHVKWVPSRTDPEEPHSSGEGPKANPWARITEDLTFQYFLRTAGQKAGVVILKLRKLNGKGENLNSYDLLRSFQLQDATKEHCICPYICTWFFIRTYIYIYGCVNI